MAEPMRFPVMAGGGPAPRDDQIRGIVERVWSDSTVYGDDVEPLLREWLAAEHCDVADDEFASLLAKAKHDFDEVALDSEPEQPRRCRVHDIVACLYRDVRALADRSAERRAASGR